MPFTSTPGTPAAKPGQLVPGLVPPATPPPTPFTGGTTGQITTVLICMYQGFDDFAGHNYQGIAADRAQAGYAALVDGAIAFGKDKIPEQSYFPRMIAYPAGITPAGGRYGVNSRPRMAVGVAPSTDTWNPLAHKWIDLNVELWGASDDDCVDLYDQFVRALVQVVSSGSYKVGNARAGKPGATTAGRRLYLTVSWWGVITLQPIPVPIQYAPAGVGSAGFAYIDNAGNPTGTQGVAY